MSEVKKIIPIGVGEWGFRNLPMRDHFKIAKKFGFNWLEFGIGGGQPGRLSEHPNEKEINEVMRKFIMKHKRIDYIVNAAGVLWFDKDLGLEKIQTNIWDKVFSINLKSMVILLKNVLPNMKKNKFGSIVNISSIDALSGDDKPQEAYGASKAAMIRLSKSIAIQYASKNIRSNTILPGPIDTPMQKRWKKNPIAKKNLSKIIPLQRVGKPENISDTVLFLLSEQSSFITGTEIIVDGGLKARP